MNEPIQLLVVEDNEIDLMMVRRMLAAPPSNGTPSPSYQIHHVSTLAGALSHLGKDEVDLVLLDLSLPDERGLCTFDRAHEIHPDLPIVVLTGLQQDSVGVEAVKRGAQDFLVKDQITPSALSRCLRYALERARYHRASRQLEELQFDQDAARAVQQQLFPNDSLHIPGFDLAGFCSPALAVGGDYYDYFPLTDGRWVVVVGDVSGHGLGSALIMTGARRLVRSFAATFAHPQELLDHVNIGVLEDAQGGRFVTMIVAYLDPLNCSFIYASAGHPGYLLRAEGEWEELPGLCPPLGVTPKLQHDPTEQRPLNRGDLLLLPTDGFAEAQPPDGKALGLGRVLDEVRQNRSQSASGIVDRLFELSADHCRPHVPPDDRSVIVLKAHCQPEG